jgi:glycosyltransferase involved in cell wall biosynthesis
VRILLVSNMYPSSERPEFGSFVQRLERALVERGNEVERVVLTAGGGPLRTPLRYLGLTWRARRAARRFRPDVVYAHYLFPTGVAAALTGVPFVITAHGGDVENSRRDRLLAAGTRWVLRRAAAVICVSRYLADRLPIQPARLEVIDCGVDTDVFTPAPRQPGDGPRYLVVGSLTERKNVGRLMEAFATLGSGSLTVVGSGPLEEELRRDAPEGVEFLGRVGGDELRAQLARADVVCQPSLIEPQGQVALEALATARPVVGTLVGGQPEFITPECGVLVDPADARSIATGMRRAAELPVPCVAAVEVARRHDVRLQAARIEAVLHSVSSPHGAAERPSP